jgi:hypothetical protein
MGDDGVQRGFFSQRDDLGFLRRYRPENPGEDFRNIDPIAGAIIDAGKATLNDLRTIYDLEDGFLLWECIAIPRFNAWRAAENSRKKK